MAEWLKIYSKKSFWKVTIFTVLLAVCINIGIYQGMDWLLLKLSRNVGDEVVAKNISLFIKNIELVFSHFYSWVVPILSGIFLLIEWILWLILKSSTGKIFVNAPGDVKNIQSNNRVKKDFVDQKIEQDRKRRLFLHSLSVLQRDGRLLDFFDEDLSLYEDDQIGAAVRSVQEDCKKTIKQYIDLKPVMEKEEGEMVTIEPGFDIDSIKLVGNVSGEPPFEGVLKHRGWKAGKKEIPKLSDIQDVAIITPAEVEIQ